MARKTLLSKEFEQVLRKAMDDARDRHHEFVTLEHVLLVLLDDEMGAEILKACGADEDELRANLLSVLAEMEVLDEEREPEQTAAFWRTIQRAAMQADATGTGVDAGKFLVAIFHEPHSHAVHFLEKQLVRRLDVMSYVSHGMLQSAYEKQATRGDEGDAEGEGEGRPKGDFLADFTVDLNARAAEGKIDPLIGRLPELERMVQVLSRRRKNNPILVGEPGVGKTAIVEGLALAIHEKRVPEALKEAVIHTLDMGTLIAGTKFRGQFEERLKGVVNAILKKPHAILFIDEIHTIVGAGATSGGSMDASNLLKPALASGDLRCIGSTTFPEYKSSFEKDKALARRFQKIDVAEPSVDETVEILKGLRSRYEAHHHVSYTDEALRAATELSQKYLTDRHLPDKAIDVIDEAGAAERLRPDDQKRKTLGEKDMEEIVAKIARIPIQAVSADDQEQLAGLEDKLKSLIYGQDPAIATITSAIKLNRSGLGGDTKPIGSFLFSGPTGVGKTELAKQLAAAMGVEFIRFDMSEYMEKHTVSRLVGAPPGYVGFDQGGLLTDAARKQPHAVLLLDEIEKAHPDVYNILLQVMDHATLTDNNGRKSDFRHIVLIMTTNAGARDMSAKAIGFSGSGLAAPARSLDGKEAMERTFSPEFRNRLDAWIPFAPLTPQAVDKVVDKFLAEVTKQLETKKVKLQASGAARAWFAEKGFDPAFGARPMGRLMQDQIRKPLAEHLLFGVLKNGGSAFVDVQDGKIVVTAKGEAP